MWPALRVFWGIVVLANGYYYFNKIDPRLQDWTAYLGTLPA
jgi:hypothetical protein